MHRTNLLTKCRALLTHRRLPIIVALLAALVTLPSLTAGMFLDDYFHKLVIQGKENPIVQHQSPLDIFRFLDGNPEHARKLIDLGVLPWSIYVGVKGAFWRPLTAVTHRLDYALWPDSPPLMHLHSILWYVLLVIAVGCLYRRMMGPASAAAGLAMILYCVDDAHATPVAFLANRNSLPAAIFGILALLAHDRWRRKGWRPGASVGMLMLAVSLLFKEEGIATFAYLLAYALFIDQGRLWKRLSALAPYVVLIIIWRIVWTHLGYGVANIGGYIDPLHEPLRFGHELIYRVPLLLLAQVGNLPPAVFVFLTPHGRIGLFLGGIAFLALLALALWPVFREDRTARFWAVGALLSVIPSCATFPDDRMLIFPGIGAMGLVAMLVTRTFSEKPVVRAAQGAPLRYVVDRAAQGAPLRHIMDRAAQGTPLRRLERPAVVALCGLLIALHLVIAVPSLMLRSYAPMGPRWLLDRAYISQPLDRAVEKQDLVVVNPPVNFFMMNSMLQWAGRGEPMPRHMRVLAPSLLQPMVVRRTDERTLVVRPEWGFLAGYDDKLMRSEAHPLRQGQVIRLLGMRAEIVGMTRDGRPAEVAFRFDVPLEDGSLRWLQWKENRFVPFHPPQVGESLTLPGLPGGIRDVLKR